MNPKGQSGQGQYSKGQGPKGQGQKGPGPKGPLAFTRQQSVLPIRGSPGLSPGGDRGSGNSRIPQYDCASSIPFTGTQNSALQDLKNDQTSSSEPFKGAPNIIQELKQEQARLNEQLCETKRDLYKALDSVHRLQADVRRLREEAATETRKAEDPVQILANVATGQLYAAVANHVFDENELLRSARGLIEDDNSIVIIIKLLIAGLVILGRDQQAQAQTVDDKIKELQRAMECVGRAVEDNPSIWHLRRVSNQALEELGAIRADICKNRTLDRGRATAIKTLVDRLVEAVGDIEKRVHNGHSSIHEAYEQAKSEQADITDWTSRFLNALVQGPSKREDETLKLYKDTLFKNHARIQADDCMPCAQKSRYAQQHEELQDMASNIKETLHAIESLREPISDSATAQPVLATEPGRKRQAEDPIVSQVQEKRIRFDKP